MILNFSDVCHLGFSNFFVASQVWMDNAHNHTKFHQNWLNGCKYIAFNVFQNGGCPSFWIYWANFGMTHK